MWKPIIGLGSGAGKTVPHPYYPVDAEIIGYEPNNSIRYALTAFLALVLVSVSTGFLLLKQLSKSKISKTDSFIVGWFLLCGVLHTIFEGYFVYHFRDIAGSQNFLAQAWKEYAKSDSRYLTRDVEVLSLETITMLVWGPLSFLSAYLTSRQHRLRYIIRTIVSVGHLYGATLYYVTSLAVGFMGGTSHSRPEPVYFWGYFIGANFPWIVVPAYLIISSVFATDEIGLKPEKASGGAGRRTKPKKTN